MSEDDICPVCEEQFNHVVENGYRNQWPTLPDQVVIVCTDDQERMFVHVEDGGSD